MDIVYDSVSSAFTCATRESRLRISNDDGWARDWHKVNPLQKPFPATPTRQPSPSEKHALYALRSLLFALCSLKRNEGDHPGSQATNKPSALIVVIMNDQQGWRAT
ncbi:hypothetical protein ACLKA7_015027 [Drosophila subpalustris]